MRRSSITVKELSTRIRISFVGSPKLFPTSGEKPIIHGVCPEFLSKRVLERS
jgi:hypothetical protein